MAAERSSTASHEDRGIVKEGFGRLSGVVGGWHLASWWIAGIENGSG